MIDLQNASLGAPDGLSAPLTAGPVRRIRHGRQADGRLRLVLDLHSPAVLERLGDETAGAGDLTLSFRILAADSSTADKPLPTAESHDAADDSS